MNPTLSVLRAIRGGVFTRADARACGYTDPDIDTLLSTGGWRRIRPGRYAAFRDLTLVTDETLHVRRTFQLLRESSGRIASHQSAAALHGLPLWGLDLSEVHLTLAAPEEIPGVLRGRVMAKPDVVRHVRSPVGPGVVAWNGIRLTSPPRAVAEVAATCPPAPAQAVADASLYSGLTTTAALRKATDHLIEGAERARGIVTRATSESASVAESRLRLILADAGLPMPSSSPPPGVDADQLGCSLWFPGERTVVEFEPYRPYWTDAADEGTPALTAYLAEAADRAFGVPRPGLPVDPSPAGHCWISWADLDDPVEVTERVRTAFARANRATAVRTLDPARRARRARRSAELSTQGPITRQS
ncbi:type IV toxin-antitoxin system AbiEi family antitoxin domain-containing protein [Kribbella sp. CA-253562]|uniref:type IV toxin-antitoxin system AbiEi family antitoxin domain-containing protein n=1 Tax=Kribbella sp. CA-253562 TaxID=3239942 RepID=UPI003D901E8A